MTTDASPIDTAPLTLHRTFRAPRSEVWAAWTNPEVLGAWWSPETFESVRCTVDVRPGGAIRVDMRAPDGTVYPMAGTFVEVVPPERLVFRTIPLDGAGEELFEVLHTATFVVDGDTTLFTLRAEVLWAAAAGAPYLTGMEAGWNQSLDKLARILDGDRVEA